MKKRFATLFVLAAACLSAAPRPPAPPALILRGTGLTETALTLEQFAALPHRTLTVKDHDGELKYEGVTVQDLLTKAGMTFGQALRGPRLRDFLLAEASDGYGVIFALPELSEEFSDRLVLVADRADGKPLPDRDGPLHIVVSDEKKHARWVRKLASLTIQTAPNATPAAK
jgi:hypothetical protein